MPLLSVGLLQGCLVTPVVDTPTVCKFDDGEYYYCGATVSSSESTMVSQSSSTSSTVTYARPQNTAYYQEGKEYAEINPDEYMVETNHMFSPSFHHKYLNEYAEQLAIKLVENLRMMDATSSVAVTSFVDLDPTLKNTNILGNQLAESLIHEIQQFGVLVVDYKTMGNIQLSESGDFAFSRVHQELDNIQKIDYILSGTLSYGANGVMVNARVVHTEMKTVIATANSVIPYFVLSSLGPRVVDYNQSEESDETQ